MPLKTPDQILLKTPFKRAIPIIDWAPTVTSGADSSVVSPLNQYIQVSQDQFISEYDPAGHKINNEHYYSNRIKIDDKGRTYIHFVERLALPMQSVITTKQLTHISGNNIKFIDSNPKPTDAQKSMLAEFKQAWINKNMEEAMHESFEMEKITGDTAFCGYIDKDGIFGWRTFGYRNGEILYPHYDPQTGKLNQFGRRYDQVDEFGKIQNTLDVWDDIFVTSYVKDTGLLAKAKALVGINGWAQISQSKHGFDRIPIAYKRNDMGACWSLSQDCIDKYELAVSQLCENNKAYAFRIMFVKGDDIDVSTVDASGQPSVIIGGDDSDAKFLEKADVSSSFELQLKILLQNIFTGSFVVIPPEVKGGDLPGVTIKILYSPALEKAMEDAMHWNSFVDNVTAIFKFGFSVEDGQVAQYNTLKVRGEIIPYVHQNDQEIINNLNSSVTMGTLSEETARAMHPYAASDENELCVAEAEGAQSVQIQSEMAKAKISESSKLNSTNQQRQQDAAAK